MKVTKQSMALMLLCGVVVGGGVTAAPQKGQEREMPPARFRFSESLRQETLTEEHGSGSSSQSALGGQVTIDFELSLKSAEGGDFTPDTPVLIKVGNFEFRSTLEKDPDYHSGDKSAILKLTSATASGKSKNILATARLRWDHDKLTGKIEGKTPGGVRSVAAEDFVGNLRGEIDGETKVRIEFGSAKGEATIPFRGKLNRIARESVGMRGEVVTINLSGDLKKP